MAFCHTERFDVKKGIKEEVLSMNDIFTFEGTMSRYSISLVSSKVYLFDLLRRKSHFLLMVGASSHTEFPLQILKVYLLLTSEHCHD